MFRPQGLRVCCESARREIFGSYYHPRDEAFPGENFRLEHRELIGEQVGTRHRYFAFLQLNHAKVVDGCHGINCPGHTSLKRYL